MKITITSIELRSPFKFFTLSLFAMNIIRQLKSTGVLKYKSTGFWTRHYTMTLWNDEKELKDFALSGAHKQAMKKSRVLAREIKILTINGDKLPDWKTAKILLNNEGKIYKY